jgi:hypothetical protein
VKTRQQIEARIAELTKRLQDLRKQTDADGDVLRRLEGNIGALEWTLRP